VFCVTSARGKSEQSLVYQINRHWEKLLEERGGDYWWGKDALRKCATFHTYMRKLLVIYEIPTDPSKVINFLTVRFSSERLRYTVNLLHVAHTGTRTVHSTHPIGTK
jgi:hypothetical protein